MQDTMKSQEASKRATDSKKAGPHFQSADEYLAYLKEELRKALRRGNQANKARDQSSRWYHL